MSQLFIFFKDESYVQLDFLFGFYRKGVEYLSKASVFEFSQTNTEGIQICSNHHLIEHLLMFNFLNFAGIPSKYLEFLKNQAPEEIGNILYYLKLKHKYSIESLEDLRGYKPRIRKALMRSLLQRPQNFGIKLFVNHSKYIFDTIKNIFYNRGFIMTFSGVDGAGKSTIIENVKETLEKKYRKNVVVLRHRPSIFPILSSYKYGKEKAEQRAGQTLPRKGNNNNTFSSILRFLYYYLDYLLGQFFINVKFVWRGYIVIYDRYYFDFIVDSKRSNIQLPKSIPTFLYRFVNHPRLNLFLYAQPQTIIQRKKELDLGTIDELTTSYKLLFESLKNKSLACQYIPIENVNKEQTIHQVIEQFEAMI